MAPEPHWLAMMRRALAVACMCLLLAGGLPARAEDEPVPPKASPQEIRAQVADWLRDLSADEFETREAARAGLRRLGLEARDLLEAAKDDEDPEVRRTVRAILATVDGRPTHSAHVRPGDLVNLDLVTASVATSPLKKVLAALGAPYGARFELDDEALGERSASLDARRVPFFDALDGVLRAQGMHLARPFDASGEAGIAAVPEGFVRPPRAACGPTQVSVVAVSATRSFGASVPERYALTVRLDWTPSVQVTQYEMPTIEVARDPQGRAYKPTAAMNRRIAYGVGSTSRSNDLTLYVEPKEDGAAPHLAVLEFSLPLTLRRDAAGIDVDLDRTLPCTVGKDGKDVAEGTDGSVRVESVNEVDGSHGQWVVEMTVTLKDDIAQRTLQTFVLEEGGKVSRLGVYGGRSRSADGTLRITARAYRGNRGRPKGLRVSWFRREEYGTLRYRLEDIPLR